jgi:YbgC/YbaW family acyl-CoA thioester hydrolase
LALSEFTYRRRVQFPETDASGIVHFTNFFKYVEEAEHSMWRAAGLSIATERDRGIGWPRIAASFQYRRPLKFEDEFDVHLRVAEKTPRTLRYSAILRKDGEVIAEGSMTIVCVRRRAGEHVKAIDIPSDIDVRFEVAAVETASEDAEPSP